MALSRKDLFTLGKTLANAKPSSPIAYSFGEDKFSYRDLDDTFRKELNEYAGTYQLFRENRNLVFSLMEEKIDEVLPKRLHDTYNMFAEVKTIGQGEKAVFTQKITQNAKRRAKQFITKVGLAGVYEVFKLDGKSYTIETSAFGGAAEIGFEEYLDGRITMADVLDIIMEGLDEAILIEIERTLRGAITELQDANKANVDGFVEAEMDKLLAVADAYGQANIYCTQEFAATMVPAEGWVSDAMKDAKWNAGYLANYKGHRVIILPQSFEDETNTTKVINPGYAYIIPTGGNDKPVKVVFEGQTAVKEVENHDWSREIRVYKKVGVGTVITNNICIYVNTALTPEED